MTALGQQLAVPAGKKDVHVLFIGQPNFFSTQWESRKVTVIDPVQLGELRPQELRNVFSQVDVVFRVSKAGTFKISALAKTERGDNFLKELKGEGAFFHELDEDALLESFRQKEEEVPQGHGQEKGGPIVAKRALDLLRELEELSHSTSCLSTAHGFSSTSKEELSYKVLLALSRMDERRRQAFFELLEKERIKSENHQLRYEFLKELVEFERLKKDQA